MTDEQAKDPRAPGAPADPAAQPPSPEEPAEESLPADDSQPSPEEASASPAAPDPAQEAEDDVDIQSKFDRPASTLGIRPPVEQSKTAAPPTGLGARPIPKPSATAAPAPATTSAPLAAPTPPAAPTQPAVPAPRPVLPPAVPVASRPPAPSPVLEEEEAPEHVPTWAERFRRLSPALVILGIGSLGALGFLVYAVTSHTTPVAVLLSAGVVVTLAFAADAFIASIATWRAAVWDEDPGRALLLAVVAGGSAIVSAGALGAVTVLILVLTGR